MPKKIQIKRAPGSRMKASSVQVASKKYVKNVVKRALNDAIEQKYDTTSFYDNAMTVSTQQIFLLNDQQIATSNPASLHDRIGRVIHNDKLVLNIKTTQSASPTVGVQTFKVWVIVAKETGGSAPTFGEVFTQQAGEMMYLINEDNAHNYKILKEITIRGDVDRRVQHRRYTIKIPKSLSKVQFDDSNNGNWSDTSGNALFLAITCDEPGTAYAALRTYQRLYFRDA